MNTSRGHGKAVKEDVDQTTVICASICAQYAFTVSMVS
jgi:hypothetical protein